MRFGKKVIIVSLLFVNLKLIAQDSLQGKWVSYSIIYGKTVIKEIEITKKDNTIIIFRGNGNYVKYDRTYNTDSSTSKLYYHLGDEKMTVTDDNGKVLKLRKVKEHGTYKVNGNEIVFITRSKRKYSVLYDLQSGVLLLGGIDQDQAYFNQFRTRFKRRQ